jgi:hypothetical protein
MLPCHLENGLETHISNCLHVIFYEVNKLWIHKNIICVLLHLQATKLKSSPFQMFIFWFGLSFKNNYNYIIALNPFNINSLTNAHASYILTCEGFTFGVWALYFDF